MQELAQAIADRLIVTPGATFNGFAIGSTEPASNVGPWFKDCEQFFVFDDETARYVPISKFSTNIFGNVQVLSASGTFIVPDFVYRLRVHAWGGGGGGADVGAGVWGGGGGAGGYGLKIFDVVPGQSIAYIIGAGGAAGAASSGGNGGNTAFLTMTANGGTGAPLSGGASSDAGVGGAVTGSDFSIVGGDGIIPATGNVQAGFGAPSANGGSGGVFSATLARATGKTPGGGGAGATAGTSPVGVSGAGATGQILIEY